MAEADALGRLARLHGIEPVWHDIWGGHHEVAPETLRALLAAMHVPAATDEQAQKAATEFNQYQLGGRALTVNEARPRPEGGFGGGGGFGGNRGGGRREPRW